MFEGPHGAAPHDAASPRWRIGAREKCGGPHAFVPVAARPERTAVPARSRPKPRGAGCRDPVASPPGRTRTSRSSSWPRRGGREPGAEGRKLGPTRVAPLRHAILMADAMRREDCFGRVDGNTFISGRGRLRSWMVDTTQFRRSIPSMASGLGPSGFGPSSLGMTWRMRNGPRYPILQPTSSGVPNTLSRSAGFSGSAAFTSK